MSAVSTSHSVASSLTEPVDGDATVVFETSDDLVPWGVLTASPSGTAGRYVEKIREVDRIATEVASASSQQSEGIAQVNVAVSQIDRITQRTAASAEETANAVAKLNSQVGELNSTLAELNAIANGGKSSASDAGLAPASRTDKSRRAQVPVVEKKTEAVSF